MYSARAAFALWSLLLILAVIPSAAHARAKVEVQVEGVSGKVKDNVLGFLSIEQQKDYPLLTDGLIDFLYRKAPVEIRRALQPFGYYRPEIQSRLEQSNGKWIARFDIDPGPRVKIAELDIRLSGEGATDPEFRKLIENLPIKKGNALEHERYEEAKKLLQQLANERGYLDAEYRVSVVRVDLRTYSAHVTLNFDTGKRYQFGAVTFFQDILNEDFLRTFIPFEEGEPYSVNALLNLQKALSDSGYFARAEVRPRRDLTQDRRVPIQVVLEPRPRNRYSAGVGFGTDTGIRGSVGWERRWLNRRGHRLDAAISGSQIHNEQSVNYRIPLDYYEADQVIVTLARTEDKVDSSDSVTNRIGLSRSRARGSWQETLSINYRQEDFTVSGVTDLSTLLMPSADWSRVKADDRIYVTRGSLLRYLLRGARAGVVSNTSFLQTEFTSKVIRRPFAGSRIIFRSDMGATAANNFEEMPLTLRFYAGGDNSVRGYDFRQLSPKDQDGNPIGGKHLVVGSVEFEKSIKKKWSAAVFFDAGNAFNDLPMRINRGAGFGVRWRSPIGLVRVDTAWGLDDPGIPQRFHLVVGPDL